MKNSEELLAKMSQLNQPEKTKIMVKQDCADKTCLRKSRINGLTFPGELDKIMKWMTSTFFSEELDQQILARPGIQKQRCVDKRR